MVTWTIKFLQAVALFCADVFILRVFGCQTFLWTIPCSMCAETDVARVCFSSREGLMWKLSLSCRYKIRAQSPPWLIILKLTRQSLILTGSRGILQPIMGWYYVHWGHRGLIGRNRDKLTDGDRFWSQLQTSHSPVSCYCWDADYDETHRDVWECWVITILGWARVRE